MRWNCPHCGVSLAVSDEKISNGWSFSRCFKCAGFALLRRSDVSLIKVDRAPAGENVLLPESHEEPTTLLSQNAANHLAHYVDQSKARQAAVVSAAAQKPVIRAAARRHRAEKRNPSPAVTMPQAPQNATRVAYSLQPPTFQPPRPASVDGRNLGFNNSLPSPLPDEPVLSFRQRMLPAAIGLTGFLAIGSGIYLYVQGQALFEKARSQAVESTATKTLSANTESAQVLTLAPQSPSNEIIQAPALAPTAPALAKAAPTAAATSISSNARVIAGSANVFALDSGRAEVTDQVHANAMAPARTPALNLPGREMEKTPADSEEDLDDDTETADETIASAALSAAEPAIATLAKQVAPKMNVQVLVKEAHIHSGPGLQYPIIGNATDQKNYAVEEWRDRWFKIVLESPEKNLSARKTAWIRNDLVRMVP